MYSISARVTRLFILYSIYILHRIYILYRICIICRMLSKYVLRWHARYKTIYFVFDICFVFDMTFV